MVRRDAQLAPDHFAEFAELLSRSRAVRGTNLAQGWVGIAPKWTRAHE